MIFFGRETFEACCKRWCVPAMWAALRYFVPVFEFASIRRNSCGAVCETQGWSSMNIGTWLCRSQRCLGFSDWGEGGCSWAGMTAEEIVALRETELHGSSPIIAEYPRVPWPRPWPLPLQTTTSNPSSVRARQTLSPLSILMSVFALTSATGGGVVCRYVLWRHCR